MTRQRQLRRTASVDSNVQADQTQAMVEYNQADTESTQALADGTEVRARLCAIEAQLNDTFVQRADAIRVILLGVISRQNYMLIGPPGTAKTSVIDCFTKHVATDRHFKILMGKFTQPEHVFGVLDIQAFKAGRYETVTHGMMTEAPLPILDEALKASDGCMNSLLGALGPEREFQAKRTKNICVGGATNWPEVDSLSKHVEALYDRFLLRCSVTAVERMRKDEKGNLVQDFAARRSLYRAAEKVHNYVPDQQVSVEDLALASECASGVAISDQVLDLLDGLIARLMAPTKDGQGKPQPNDLEISDRRAAQLQSVLRANAWLEGRIEVSIEDFEVLRHGLWAKHKHVEAVQAVLDVLDQHTVQRLIRRIDQGRSAFRALQQANFPVAGCNRTVDEIKVIAAEVRKELEAPVFTKKGRDMVRDGMLNLKSDYEQIVAKAKKLAGG